MDKVEELKIYKEYINLIYYTEMITKKFPKAEKTVIVKNIRDTTYKGMDNIIKAERTFHKQTKLKNLQQLDSNLKLIKVFIRISYKNKYINVKNYASWSNKLLTISNMLGNWLKNV